MAKSPLETAPNRLKTCLWAVIAPKAIRPDFGLAPRFFFICLGSKDLYQFDHRIDLYELRPKYFLLYNNICSHSIFDNSYLKFPK